MVTSLVLLFELPALKKPLLLFESEGYLKPCEIQESEEFIQIFHRKSKKLLELCKFKKKKGTTVDKFLI